MRVTLRKRVTRRIWLATRPVGWLATELRLRVRWLRWRRSIHLHGEAAGGEPARGFRFTAKWCARQARSGAGHTGERAWCTVVFPSHPAARGRIHSVDGETVAAMRFSSRSEVPEVFVARIPRARIVGNRGDVITPDGYWLPDLSTTDRRYVHRNSPFVERPVSANVSRLDGTVAQIADSYAWGNYAHWLMYTFPRLELYRRAGIDLDAVDHIVVNRNPGRYWQESLERVGVPMERLVECDEDFHATTGAVLVTSNLRYSPLMPWAHEFLRQTFLRPSEANGPERIFVSRGDTYWRPLVNERECFALLEQHGFVEVRLSGMSISEQAALFAGASCIAAPHDAGLTNLAFCSPGTAVVELLAPQHRVVVYAQACAVRELDYYCLFGDAAPDVDAHNPFRVRVDDLARLLEAAGV